MGNTIFISNAADRSICEILSQSGDVRKLPSFSCLPKPVASHADMLLFSHDRLLYLPEGYFRENSALFSDLNYITVKDPLPEYPYDIILDCLMLGKYLICNEKYTSPELILHYVPLNVNQGYARCSTLKLSDSAIITADRTIASAASEIGCEVLVIQSGHIFLEGYNYGFIGGASCVVGDSVIFFGNLSTHPDADKITDFIVSHGKRVINSSRSDIPLTDFGGAVIV